VACSVRCAYRLTRQLNMPPLKTVGARRQTAARRGGVPRQERVNGSRSVVGPWPTPGRMGVRLSLVTGSAVYLFC